MKITVNKENEVSLRDQMIEQIALQIASGELKSKDKLPSIRALADRLGIHYSTVTAAYNHLAEVGLLEIRQGSGVRVSAPPGTANTTNQAKAGKNGQSLDRMFEEFLARCADSGFSREDVADSARRHLKLKPIKRIVIVDRNNDFHPILLNELKPHFKLPVEAVTVEGLHKDKTFLEDALILSSLYHVFSLQDLITDTTRLMVLNIEPGLHEITAVQEMKSGQFLLLVSVSDTMLKMATKLMAAVRGDEISVRSVRTDDDKELTHATRFADLILLDSASEAKIKHVAPGKKSSVFRLFSPATLQSINDRLSKWG